MLRWDFSRFEAHRIRGAGDLFHRFALGTKPYQKSRNLNLGGLTRHHLSHRVRGFSPGKVCPTGKSLNRF